MDSFLFTVVSFVVALGILISVHEFGHFWVARKLGVKVLRFSIGFGKALWRKTGKVDGTEYVVAAVPLGGYVKMLDEREGEVPSGELQRAFNRQTLKVRSAIVVAGPAANFLFAIAAFWLIFVLGDSGTRPWIGAVEEDSVAYAAGFLPDDELLAIGDRNTPTWETAVYALLAESVDEGMLSVRVLDSNGVERIRLLPAEPLAALAESGRILEGIGLSPKRPEVPPLIGQVIGGEAADLAGIQTGDLVRSANGEAVKTWQDLVSLIREQPGKTITLEVERGSELLSIPVIIGSREENGKFYGRIGAAVQVREGLYDDYRAEIRLGPVAAAGAAVSKTWDMSVFMLKILGRMLTGKTSVKNLSGPISIAQSAGKSASYGLVYFVKFLALVSISLGVLNLLPVPVLDGGHLLFFLAEAIKGAPLSEQFLMQGQRIGLVILLALMGLAFYVDLSRLLG